MKDTTKLLCSFALATLMVNSGNLLRAQSVGINTTGNAADASSMLDVSATNRGMLIPRVALTATNSATPITSPATSLLVYNTATAGTAPNNVTPGFYYWSGTAWVQLRSGANTGNAWNTTGNAGTAPATNFLGTTDNQPLVLRTNNTERLRVIATGSVGIGTTTPNSVLDLGTNAGSSVTDVNGKKLAIYNNAAGTDFYGLGVNDPVLQFHAGSTTAEAPQMVLTNGGLLGLGTTNPSQKLAVVDGTNANQFQGIASFTANNLTQGVGIGFGGIQSIGTDANVNLNLNARGTGNIIMQTNGTTGRVGIGNTAPASMLNVTGSLIAATNNNPASPLSNSFHDLAANAGASEAVVLRVVNTSASATNNTALIGFNAYNAGGATWAIGPVQNDASSTNSNFHIHYSSGGGYFRWLTVTNTGNVGIGTPTPATRLQVAGSFSTTISFPNTCGCVVGNNSMVPAGTSHFSMVDANYSPNATLPAAAADGQRMIMSNRANNPYTINIANTTLAAPLLVSSGQAYEFVYVGGAWLRLL